MSALRSLLLALAIPLLASTAAAALQQTSWPMYQVDARHTGYLPIALDPNSIQLKWTALVAPGALNPVTAADGRVFVTIDGGNYRGLYVIEKDTGLPLWSVLYPGVHSVNPASVDGGRVYLQTGNHSSDTWLRCYDAATGASIFRSPFQAQWEEYYAPTIDGGTVFINGGYYGGMYAFDGVTGSQIWFRDLPQYDEWTPAVDAQRAYAYVGGWFYALNRATGSVAYSFQDPGYSWSGYSMQMAPVLGTMNDAFFINNGRLLCADLQTQSFRWSLSGNFSGQPSLRQGVVYAIKAGSLEAFSELDGAFLWRWIPPSGNLVDTIALTDTHAVVRTSSSTDLVSLQTHQSEWSHPASGRLTLAESNLYLALSDGNLMCFAYQATPKPHAIDPNRQPAYGASTRVTITGTGFEDPAGTSVLFGNQPATNVLVLNATTIECDAPNGDAGRVDVTVVDSNGSGTLPESFTNIPAQILSGDFQPGGFVQLVYAVQRGHEIVALWSRADLRTQGVVTPPFQGKLWLAQQNLLFQLPSWPAREYTFVAQVPNDPGLSGLTVHFQALSGSQITGAGNRSGAWTNVVSATIQ